MDDYDSHLQRLMDVTRESNFALWNALLTLNGIVASVFSAVAIFEERIKPVAFLIVLLSMLSALLVILNYRSTRDHYRSIGRTAPEDILRMSGEEKKQRLAGSARKHEACNRRETLCFVALGVQGLAILALLCWKH